MASYAVAENAPAPLPDYRRFAGEARQPIPTMGNGFSLIFLK